ncbi:hypothetical protein [Ectobacillus panaciterrae]|nr:hypothetical protein [Ectobacillus panaciterrae]
MKKLFLVLMLFSLLSGAVLDSSGNEMVNEVARTFDDQPGPY